jgi:hypothetical protein
MPAVCWRDNLGNANVCSIAEIDADDRQAHEISNIGLSATQHQLTPTTCQGKISTYSIHAPMSAFPLISIQSALG